MENVDTDGEIHEEEGYWTLVDKGRKSPKSPKAGKASRPVGFGVGATPYPLEIKFEIWCGGTWPINVYAPPNSTSEEIKRNGFSKDTRNSNLLPTQHLRPTENFSEWVYFPPNEV